MGLSRFGQRGLATGSEPQSIQIHLNFDIEEEIDLGGGLRRELADYISIEPLLDVMRVVSEPKKGGTELEVGLVSSTMVVEEVGWRLWVGSWGELLMTL